MKTEKPTQEKRSYDPRDIANKIAKTNLISRYIHKDHDTYKQKVLIEDRFGSKQKYGPDLKIKSRADFAKHIERTITDPKTLAFKGVKNRDLYYNKETNTVVIVNKDHQHRSTCYRDKTKEKHYETLKDRDQQQRVHMKLEDVKEREGGIDALYMTYGLENTMPEASEATLDKQTAASAEQSAYPAHWGAGEIAAYERLATQFAAEQERDGENTLDPGRTL